MSNNDEKFAEHTVDVENVLFLTSDCFGNSLKKVALHAMLYVSPTAINRGSSRKSRVKGVPLPKTGS